MKSQWNNSFYQTSPLFSPITETYLELNTTESSWPDLEDFQQLLKIQRNKIENINSQPIHFIAQRKPDNNFANQYEPLIYKQGKVQTRLQSWHDFFQVLVWICFPKIKAVLNAMHYQEAVNRLALNSDNKQRSRLENFLTLFDECGTIIVTSNEYLIELVKEHEWKKLFIEYRTSFSQEIECIVFGHAIYEKAITPYIGMTAQCLFLKQPKSFFQLSQQEKNQIIDIEISTTLIQAHDWNSKMLQPLPLLGIPGWCDDNKHCEFYDNLSYFRKKPFGSGGYTSDS